MPLFFGMVCRLPIIQETVLVNLPRARAAAYTAITSDGVSRCSCTDGTRVEILGRIRIWARSQAVDLPPVFWISGLAGQGKTTIAYTVCQQLEEDLSKDARNVSVVSFFCSKQLDSHEERRLVSTLVMALAESSASFAAEVVETLRRQHNLIDQKLEVQFKRLLLEPWEKSTTRRQDLLPVVIIIDAMDENDVGVAFMGLLFSALKGNHLRGLRFLITSRPKQALKDIPGYYSAELVLHLSLFDIGEEERAVLDSDILRYLNDALPQHAGAPYLKALAQSSGGLFIYASTAVLSIRPDPNEILKTKEEETQQIQELVGLARKTLISGGNHNNLLDVLYADITSKVLSPVLLTATQLANRIQFLLSFIICSRIIPVSVTDLYRYAGVDQSIQDLIISGLQAVLYVDRNESTLLSYHASFQDYILRRYEEKIYPASVQIVRQCWKNLIADSYKSLHDRRGRDPRSLKDSELTTGDLYYSIRVASSQKGLHPHERLSPAAKFLFQIFAEEHNRTAGSQIKLSAIGHRIGKDDPESPLVMPQSLKLTDERDNEWESSALEAAGSSNAVFTRAHAFGTGSSVYAPGKTVVGPNELISIRQPS